MRLISLSVVLAIATTAACAQTSASPNSTSTAQAAAKPAAKTRLICVTEDGVNSRVARRVCHTETVTDDASAAPASSGSGISAPAG